MTGADRGTARARACLVAAAAAVALLLAGCSSGPLGARPQILDNPGVTPSATGDRDEITITFSVSDEDLTKTSVQVHYTTDGGTNWYPATLVPGSSSHGVVSGDTVQRIVPTAGWTACQVNWDSYANGVALGADTPVELRLTPTDIDGTGTPVYVSSFNVNNNYAALVIDTASIVFAEGHTGVPGVPPPVVSIGLISNGTSAFGTTLQWTITPDYGADPAWLQFSPAAAGTCAVSSDITLTATVQAAGLTERAAPYVAELAITGVDQTSGTAAHDALQYVTVSIVVRNPESDVFVHDNTPPGSPSPVTALSFVCFFGADPAPQTFWVENSGETGSTLSWTASDDANVTSPADWLSAAATVPPAEVAAGVSEEATVTVTASALPAGTYDATITVSGEDTSFMPPDLGPEPALSERTVDVSLWVQTPAELAISATGNAFPYWVNKAANPYAPESFVVTVTNLGDEPLDWNVTFPAGQPAWVTSVTPLSGTGLPGGVPANVTVTVDADAPPGLAASLIDWTCPIKFTATNGVANFESFTASIHVYNPAIIVCNPSTLNFTRLGFSSPPGQSFTITRTGTNVPPVQWSTTTPVPPTEAWVWTLPGSGTLTTGSPSITVNITGASLASGNYSATITLNSNDTTDPAATVTVNLTVINDVTIGAGTLSWGYPMYTFYEDSRTQVIYLQSEIGGAGWINGLSLDVTTIPGQTMNNWTIRMKHTALSQYATPSWEGAAGWITVYQSNETVGSLGWVKFNFSTPFSYNGTSNLMIDFSHNNASFTSSGLCRRTAGGTPRVVYSYADSWAGDPLNWVGPTAIFGSVAQPYTSSNTPNVKLSF